MRKYEKPKKEEVRGIYFQVTLRQWEMLNWLCSKTGKTKREILSESIEDQAEYYDFDPDITTN